MDLTMDTSAKMNTVKYNLEKNLVPSVPNAIPVVFASDNNFSVYTSVAIESIIQNSKDENNYDIFILTEDISEDNELKIKSQIRGKKNFTIQFYNVKKILEESSFSASIVLSHIKKPAYYRLFIASIFQNFHKVIYLDGDLILNTDVAELHNVELDGKSIGAVRDFFVSSEQQSNTQDSFKKYSKEILNIDNLSNYFNSGVLLIDVKKLIEKKSEVDLIRVAKINNKFFHDQNVLNSVFFNDVKIISKFWNYQKFNRLESDEPEIKIFHYCNKYKPWNSSRVMFSDHFWKYAKSSPFYDSILKNYLKSVNKFSFNDSNLNYNIKLFSLKMALFFSFSEKAKNRYSKKLEKLIKNKYK